MNLILKIIYFFKSMSIYIATSAFCLLLMPLIIELIGRVAFEKTVFGKYLTIAIMVIGIIFSVGIILSILEKILKKFGRH